MKRFGLLFALLLGFAVPSFAQSPRAYVASVGGQATTAAVQLSIEAPAAEGFRLSRLCVGSSNATAAAAVTITVQRTTTASSGGTALTAEGTGTTSVSKLFPTDANFPGIARLGGTPGTAGAVISQQGFTVGPLTGAPFATVECITWEQAARMPTVAPGVVNGLLITVSSAGAGGLASGSIAATILMGN